jgi:PAS domain S-box-containing protein
MTMLGKSPLVLPRGSRASVSAAADRRILGGGHIMSADFDFERFCQVLVREVSDAVIYVNDQGVVHFWNAGAERIFGFSEAEATGKSLDIIIPEEHRARHWSGFYETIRTGKTRYGGGSTLAVVALRKDGRRISVEFSILPFRGDDGTTLGVAAILRDVTERLTLMTGVNTLTLLGR